MEFIGSTVVEELVEIVMEYCGVANGIDGFVDFQIICIESNFGLFEAEFNVVYMGGLLGVDPGGTLVVHPDLKNRCLKPRGQFPSEYCNKFVNCWDNNVAEQECPEGLLFSPDKVSCDWPSNVECGDRIKLTLKDKCLEPRGQFATEQNCPKGLLFSTTKSYCDWPANVECGNRIKPDDDVDSSLIDKCLKPKGQFPMEYCEKFVNCWNGNVAVQKCPEGLLFSAEKSYCDWPANVDCGDRIKPGTKPSGEVLIRAKKSGLGQNWTLVCQPIGSFIIRNDDSGMVLDLKSGCDKDTEVIVYEEHGRTNQLFYINGDGTISSACNRSWILQVDFQYVKIADRAVAVADDLDVYFDIVDIYI
ncbi:hypothetical protein JTB14_026111 [Gonioctena quinquepunctata]|nr:hypothetical protein JTB14_026111 [Gonioctena quinquepunctata]